MTLRQRVSRMTGHVRLIVNVILLRLGIVQNPLFDYDWCRSRYPDVPTGRRRAYREYRRRPLSDPRDPNRYLDMRWFLAQQTDLLTGRLHPLDHYLLLGWREGREPKPGFDTCDLLRRYPDCGERGLNPLVYLLRPDGPVVPVARLLPDPSSSSELVTPARKRRPDGGSDRLGAVRLVAAAIVEGWLHPRAEAEEVEVVCDGELVWRGMPRRVIIDPKGREHARGFRVDLPGSTARSRRSRVEARAVGAGQLQGSPMLADGLDQFFGHVDAVVESGDLQLDGWAHDRARPLDPIEVEVLFGDRVAATITAGRYRPDLERAGIGVGWHAIREALPLPATSALTVTIRIAGTPLVLCRQRLPASSRQRGSVAAADPHDGIRRNDEPAVGRRVSGRVARDAPFGNRPSTRIAFAVTEVNEGGGTGDYFTALELGSAMEALGSARVTYLDLSRDWYALEGVDVLIAMRDDYDLWRARSSRPGLVAVAWARNWFERWAERPWVQDYDLIWASSDLARAHLAAVLDRSVSVLPMATNPQRFERGTRRPELSTDYCFTGSFFYAPREVMYDLVPVGLPFEFGVFGHGWEHAPAFGPFVRGPVPYPSMPDVYASTRLVIDDAQFPVKVWGSVNCRVFDAIAAGAVVVTNGDVGARELFGNLLPTYSNKQELDDLLWTFLTDDHERVRRARSLRDLILDQHTYSQRARQALAEITEISS